MPPARSRSRSRFPWRPVPLPRASGRILSSASPRAPPCSRHSLSTLQVQRLTPCKASCNAREDNCAPRGAPRAVPRFAGLRTNRSRDSLPCHPLPPLSAAAGSQGVQNCGGASCKSAHTLVSLQRWRDAFRAEPLVRARATSALRPTGALRPFKMVGIDDFSD